MICQLAHSILDGTVFEIAIGLKDIQRITEKNLLKRRNVVVNDHRRRTFIILTISVDLLCKLNMEMIYTYLFIEKKTEIVKRHEKEIENSQSKPHQILVLEKQQKEEINVSILSVCLTLLYSIYNIS